MKKTVIRNAEGEIINIGPWDDMGGANPLPAGAVVEECKITTDEQGGLRAPEDHRGLRAAAYPPIREQLDMLFWDQVNGTRHWVAAVEAVKAAYPKTSE
ncbi:hypothetical protein [Telmatospirillum sp. J64-1]|uniref:hypothetical protein n=1 Tax=Telmatospirillum sp. J64-1 TaxID=2502183 RepID=UPI00115D2279|nr:hypothetical protein [Telmatospirillum sp. J64-1]